MHGARTNATAHLRISTISSTVYYDHMNVRISEHAQTWEVIQSAGYSSQSVILHSRSLTDSLTLSLSLSLYLYFAL